MCIRDRYKKNYIEYLLDILLYGSLEERKALVAEQRKEVLKLEQRIAEPVSYTHLYRPARFSALCLSGELHTYLADLNEQATERRSLIIEQVRWN